MVSQRYTTRSFKDKCIVERPPEEWVIVENTQEPLVDQATFDTVQERIKIKQPATWTNTDNMFRGLLIFLRKEQYRDPKLAQLRHDYLAGGSLEYMAVIFRKLADSDEEAMQLALEFYGPMYLLYSVYDGAEKKNWFLLCWRHIWSAMCCTVIGMTRHLCRNWIL